ncbi:DUF742 domain-containing protein [Actinacidiphila sp. DG2A-62]|uniref:DUF742 domain-containing protein n=1 Tax=Actinacidiphila sp. DG2A-62 TaxID=3108821 RepID=UPI002DB59D39|nr:DUF742 domain-containing protein [Actinacidiphila sp. DG2A-62]MEC3997208.1 DUF742 domain-containing protein [Actinacidiphila sp. DG2A-62]
MTSPPPRSSGRSGQSRPYASTAGRVHAPDETVGLDTQVLARRLPQELAFNRDQQRVLELCRTPAAVAELAARMRLPLGVVTVLVRDLLAAGAVTATPPLDMAGASTVSTALLQRIAAGLRRSLDDLPTTSGTVPDAPSGTAPGTVLTGGPHHGRGLRARARAL